MDLDIEKVATLANLPLTENEKNELEGQLKNILLFVEKLNEIDTTGVEPTSQVTGKVNEVREDIVQESLGVVKATHNAQHIKDSHFVTKGVFEDE